MSKLEQLIAELCPNGVEFRPLAKLSKKLVDGMHSLPKGLSEDGLYPVISAQNIANGKIDLTSSMSSG